MPRNRQERRMREWDPTRDNGVNCPKEKILDLAINFEKEVFKKNEKALKDKDKAESAYKTDMSQIIKTINDEKIGKELI